LRYSSGSLRIHLVGEIVAEAFSVKEVENPLKSGKCEDKYVKEPIKFLLDYDYCKTIISSKRCCKRDVENCRENDIKLSR
jgi:hypothetical protein